MRARGPRLASLLLLLLVVVPLLSARDALPVSRRPAGAIRLLPDAEQRWVSFDLTPGNQVRFRMTVDGRPATAILDTGVSYSVMSRAFAAGGTGRVRPGGTASAVGGTVPVGWVPTAEVAAGGLVRRGGGLAVAVLPASATGTGRAVDLLVGRDLLAAAALDIDYPNGRFRLLPSGRLPFRGAVAPLWVSPDRRVYEGELLLRGRRLRPVVIDTGDGSAVTVTRAAWAASGLDTLPSTTALTFGLAGQAVTDLAVVPDLRVGDLAARQVEVRAEPPGGFSEALRAEGRIGTGLLGRYRVLLDPGAGRMVFLTGLASDAPPRRSTSGLLLGLDRGRLRVLHVMRGGPAAAAGWRRGDLICAVDGRPVGPDYAAEPGADWPAGEPGRTVRLAGCGEGAPVRALTLRRFY